MTDKQRRASEKLINAARDAVNALWDCEQPDSGTTSKVAGQAMLARLRLSHACDVLAKTIETV